VLSRVGSNTSITGSAEPTQGDGRICLELPKTTVESTKPGRYTARLTGAPGCDLCFPVEIGAKCGLASVDVSAPNGCDDSCATVQETTPTNARPVLRR
jgi:hypothetical protein